MDSTGDGGCISTFDGELGQRRLFSLDILIGRELRRSLQGGSSRKAPEGVDGLGTIIAGKATPCVLATPEGDTAEGTPGDTPVITGVCGKGIACC